MRNKILRLFVLRLFALSLVSLGFMQTASAGLIGTGALADAQSAEASVAELRVLLEREDVAAQLSALGVDSQDVLARVGNMSDAEIMAFQERLDAGVAGGDAVAIIGTVFLVLLILELVGVTDVFKAI